MKKPRTPQEKYLYKKKSQQQMIGFFRIFLLFTFFVSWEWSAQTKLLDSFIFSSPSRICRTFCVLWTEQNLPMHIGTTLFETFASFLLVTVISLIVALLLWLFPTVASITEPFLIVLNSLPKSALAPLLIVWLGSNTRTIIIAGISVAIFGSIINLYVGFQSVDPDKLKLITTLGGSPRHQLTKVLLPSSLGLLLGVMKVNIGLCLVGVIIGEFIGSHQGLGYLIIYGTQVFKLDWVIMSILILCIFAMMFYFILQSLENFYKRKH